MKATRREFMAASLLLGACSATSSAVGAGSDAVKLVLFRQRVGPSCAPCTPGRLFGVPAGLDINAATSNHPLLQELAYTLELGPADNLPRSSIPAGIYSGRVRVDATKAWMWSGRAVGSGSIIEDRAWRIELAGVPHRTHIQFHYGLDAGWSAGCIIVADGPVDSCLPNCARGDSPVAGVRRIRSFVQANATSSPERIVVRVVDG